MVITKQSIGIDVSKDSLDVVFKEQNGSQVKIKGSRKFDNKPLIFCQIIFFPNPHSFSKNHYL